MLRGLRSIFGLAAVAAFLIAPATSQATLVFTRNPFNPTVFAASDNGSEAHKIGSGRSPRVSPDGQTIVYMNEAAGTPRLTVVPAAGGASRTLMSDWQESFYLAFSPDSTTIAALRGPGNGPRKLVLVDVASGVQRVVASGYFNGFSFSPDGTELAYSKAGSENFPVYSDVYRVDVLPPGAVGVAAEQPQRLTNDHRSSDPLWGPNGKIVFVKHRGEKRRKYGPKNELYLMNPSGKQVKRLTHTKVGPLVSGLSPTAWSASGERLLAEFGGQDTTYAVTVNPKTGAERALTKQREEGFVGTAISSDGKFVLGSLGGFEPGPGHDVVSIPYAGGKPKVLANNASEADWSR